MQLSGKRDALMPPNPEELLNRPQRVARLCVGIHQSSHTAMATRDVMENWSLQSLTHSPKMLFFSIIAPTMIGLSRHAKLS
jgi:hypothetical protein